MIIEQNAFIAGPEGIFTHNEKSEQDFAYSDGSSAEIYLDRVLEQAADLSSDSEELQGSITDWPSEYHLTSRRANLFRPFDLKPGETLLELGCGCGAITRYLGERGLKVDAIEGSIIRARLARKRCRDLDNVRLIHANFNRVDLPEAHYDYATLIGVIEYARMFSPDSGSDRDAALSVLKSLARTIKPGGRVFVAIENRTGMKYLHGAHEDHYSKRFVGIDNYSEPAGIRTFTRQEWIELAREAGYQRPLIFGAYPDYKIPEVLLSEDYSDKDPNAWCHLEGIHSSDYTFLFDPHVPESLIWQGYNAAGVLADFANSFFLVLSREPSSGFSSLEFAHLPDFQRKRAHCRMIRKYSGEPNVRRGGYPGGPDVEESCEPLLPGKLLSSIWARGLLTHSDSKRFFSDVRQYRDFLEDYRSRNGNLPTDLLPNNIIVDEQGNWQVFDQEWQEPGNSVSYILFRALLTFANHYRPAIRSFCRRHNLLDVEAFIRFGFAGAGIDEQVFNDYCEKENRFQEKVLVNRAQSIDDVLSTPLQQTPISITVSPTLYWRGGNQGFDPTRSVGLGVTPSAEMKTIVFELPCALGEIDELRFDPCDENRPHESGLLTISSVRLIGELGSDKIILWQTPGDDAVSTAEETVQLLPVDDEGMWAVAGDDPHLKFALHCTDQHVQNLKVEVDWKFTLSREFRQMQYQFIETRQALHKKIRDMEIRVERARSAEADLAKIRQSTSWRLITRIGRLLGRGE